MKDDGITEISIPYPEAGDRHLRISVGACRLAIRPGQGPEWISGSYRNPSGALPCRITQSGGTVSITQEYNWADALGRLGALPTTLDLAIARANPYALTLETGASDAIIDLGGAPIDRLSIKQGAGKVVVDFSAPNPSEMRTMTLNSGASSVELRNLANANFAEMEVEGGAAAYKFDFGGTPQRDGRVNITVGMSSVELHVPASTAAKIYSEPVLGGVDVGDGFMKKEGGFWTEAALAGKSPLLTIYAKLALGSLKLRTT